MSHCVLRNLGRVKISIKREKQALVVHVSVLYSRKSFIEGIGVIQWRVRAKRTIAAIPTGAWVEMLRWTGCGC